MKKRLFSLAVLVVLAATIIVTDFQIQAIDLHNISYTAIALGVIYTCYFAISEFIVGRVRDLKTRYTLRKSLGLLAILVFLIITFQVWVINPETLTVAYGLVGAGVAIALKDFFKNFAGGIVIFVSGAYRVGDRVEIEDNYGDVIDIGMFSTTLLELQEWAGGDQATGRLTLVPNGHVLSSTIQNYTRDHEFIWDEITVPVTYESDWREAEKILKKIAKDKTKNDMKDAEDDIKRIGRKYYMTKRDLAPSVFLTLTDNWIELRLRYITNVRKRRKKNNALSAAILRTFEKEKEINIASETIKVLDTSTSKKKGIKKKGKKK